jgi:catechol 2,3-dioxygenase-like lactoylglutathione lyase family enzyme
MLSREIGENMIPTLTGIDHVHVYVTDRQAAEDWYRDVMGFERVEALMSWATEQGPLTLEDPSGTVHLALFESDQGPDTTIAFGANGDEFLAWKAHLEANGLDLRVADHDLAFSLYFRDPDGNMHEITTYQHEFVRGHLS